MSKNNTLITLAAGLSVLAGFFLARTLSTVEPEIAAFGLPETPETSISVTMIGKRRPDFSLADITGRVRHIDEWDGQVLTINFWASWCSPCLQEIPELVDLQARYGAAGLQVIGIALQKPEELGDFVREYKMNYPVLAGEEAVIEIAENYGNTIGALPYTAIINRKGDVVFVKAGPVTGQEVEHVINSLL